MSVSDDKATATNPRGGSMQPENTSGWTRSGDKFQMRQSDAKAPIIAIDMDQINNGSKNIPMSANQYLMYTMLHALGHVAGIGEHNITASNGSLFSLMNSGTFLGHNQLPTDYFFSATSASNNSVWRAFMMNYFVTYPALVRNYKSSTITPFSFLPFYTIPNPNPSSFHPLNFMLNGYSQYIYGAD